MKEERMSILKMLETGKISAQEAYQLLGSLDSPQGAQVVSGTRKLLKVEVIEAGEAKVKMNVPLALAKVALKFIPKSAFAGNDLDIEQLLHEIEGGAEGNLVEVNDGDTRVVIGIA